MLLLNRIMKHHCVIVADGFFWKFPLLYHFYQNHVCVVIRDALIQHFQIYQQLDRYSSVQLNFNSFSQLNCDWSVFGSILNSTDFQSNQSQKSYKNYHCCCSHFSEYFDSYSESRWLFSCVIGNTILQLLCYYFSSDLSELFFLWSIVANYEIKESGSIWYQS